MNEMYALVIISSVAFKINMSLFLKRSVYAVTAVPVNFFSSKACITKKVRTAWNSLLLKWHKLYFGM